MERFFRSVKTERVNHLAFINHSSVVSVVEQTIDRIFVLHAEHEQNVSTSTVRLASSSGADPFACIAAGIASLWAPLTVVLTKLAWKC